ncbi:hypothetical protein BGZ47_005811 [Haplosporangium gracile]|nr:hypothetical protein BGZ47_005811 [Haplosporangium gracile]
MTLETYTIFPTNKHNRPTPPAKVHLYGLDGHSAAIQIHNYRFFRRPFAPITEVIEQLKATLAEALELYPPVAGTGEIFIAMDKEGIVGTPFLVDFKDTPFVKDFEDLSPRTELILLPMASILAVKVTQFSYLREFLDFLELWAQFSRGEPVDFTRILDDWEQSTSSGTGTLRPLRYSNIRSIGLLVGTLGGDELEVYKDFDGATETRSFTTCWFETLDLVGGALAALVSGAITRARQDSKVARLEGRSSEESDIESIAIAADGRERAPKGNMSEGRYLGNFNNLWGLTVPLSDLSTPTTEATGRAALAIRTHHKVQISAESVAKRWHSLIIPRSGTLQAA